MLISHCVKIQDRVEKFLLSRFDHEELMGYSMLAMVKDLIINKMILPSDSEQKIFETMYLWAFEDQEKEELQYFFNLFGHE